MARSQVAVTGLRETITAFNRAGSDTRRFMRDTLRPVGDIVREEWSLRFSDVDERSAAGLRTSVRQLGVSVRQSLRKVTGLRGDYGQLQMRYGDETLDDKQDEVVDEFADAIDHVLRNFER